MTDLVSLLNEIEARGREMPGQLQQALQNGGQLQTHLEACSQSARSASAVLQERSRVLESQMSRLDGRVQNEHKRQSERLADASSGLNGLHKLGQQLAHELADESRQTEAAIEQLNSHLNTLSHAVYSGIDKEQTALGEGLAKMRKSQERLAATCTKVVKDLGQVSEAVKKSSDVCNQAVNRYLTCVQTVVSQGSSASDGFLNASREALNRLDVDLGRLHAETLAPQVLGRASQYVQSVTDLKGAAVGAFYRLQSAGTNQDKILKDAKTRLDEGYSLHKLYTEGKSATAKTKLVEADAALDAAWKAIPLDEHGNKDERNIFQKAVDGLKGMLVSAWEAASWVIKGVSQWVADNHKIILGALVGAAVVAGAVILAPFVWPVLVATAPTALAVVGGGLVAGMSLAGSAAAGIGVGVMAVGLGGAAFAIGNQMLNSSPMEFLNNVGSTISKLPGAIAYTASRFLTFASKGPNALGLAASLITLNPLPLLATMAVTNTVGAFEMSKDLIDPKRVQPPENYTIGKSVAEMERVYALAKMGRMVFGSEAEWSADYKSNFVGDGFAFGHSFEDSGRSFRVETYTKGDEVVLVYRGSTMDNKGQNWMQNFQQGEGWEAYGPNSIYQEAVAYAKQVQSENPGKKITLTGHSLGGSLVQVASAVTGLEGVTFNSAGVNPLTLNAFGKVREDIKNTNFDVAGQLLDQLQDGMASGAAVGLVAIPYVGPVLAPVALLASDSQVGGTNIQLAARDKNGTSLMDLPAETGKNRNNTTYDLHLWDAVEKSVERELELAKKREGVT